ncbi:MAG: mechanosensitive ion channel family protein, partial [Alistipes sp.]|nr:mechanosensitive ion channel family protein [Alistipes sp.]
MTLPHPPVEDSALVQWAHQVLVRLGLKPETAHLLDQFVIIAAILLTAWLMDWLFRTVLLAVGQRIIRHTQRRWSELLLNRQVLRKFSDLTPVAFVYLLIPLAFPAQSHLPVLIRKICVIYEIFVFTLVLNVILKVFFGLLSLKDVKHERPLKGLLQLLQIGLFCVSGIAIVSLLFGQSPLRLLTGLG